jgi:hypothetical protein
LQSHGGGPLKLKGSFPQDVLIENEEITTELKIRWMFRKELTRRLVTCKTLYRVIPGKMIIFSNKNSYYKKLK